jgi:hypothetical protein
MFIILLLMVIITAVFLPALVLIAFSIVPISLVVALRALFVAVLARSVFRMTGDAIGLGGMVEVGIIPIVGVVTG